MKYVIHKKLVSYHSTFFKAALNGSFLEGQNNQVKLEEELLEVFNGFVHWLYPIWWPGGPFFCHRLPPPEFRRAPLKNQRLGRAPLNN
jgi:hypothetical protein